MAKRTDDDDDYEFDADAEDVDEADDDVDDADDYDDEPEEEEAYEEEAPRLKPRVTLLTVFLIILNIGASLGFVFLLMLNIEKRQAFTYAGLNEEFKAVGVGTDEDRKDTTAAVVSMPKQKLTSEALKAAASARGVSGSGDFIPVEDGIRYGLYGPGVDPELLKELMSDLGDPVGSIDEEMRRLKNVLPGKIQLAAEKIVENTKGEAAKKNKAALLLLPLCFDTYQIDKLDKRIQAAKGPAVDALLNDAVQRRIIADILAPVEMYRPGDAQGFFVEKICDPDVMKLDDLKNLLTRRLDAAASDKQDGAVFFGQDRTGEERGTVEKRQNAAFLLVSLAYARNHQGAAAKFEDQFLEPKGLERAQRLSGLHDFTAACLAYTDALRKLESRVLTAISIDREGFQIDANNQLRRSEGFIDKQAEEIYRIRQVQLEIRKAQERLKDLQDQRDRSMKLYTERLTHLKDVEARVRMARAATATRAEELRKLQSQLFLAQRELADASENNLRLTRDIERISTGKGLQP